MAYGFMNVGDRPAVSEEGTVVLTNTQNYPFNDSIITVALGKTRAGSHYIVVPEVLTANGNAGSVIVSDVLENGFKLSYTGSATTATVKYKIIGG